MPELEVRSWQTSHICAGLSQKTGTWPETPFLGLSKSVHCSNNLVRLGRGLSWISAAFYLYYESYIVYSLLVGTAYLGNMKSAVDGRFVI